jgi:hypothetical protein
MFSSTDFLPFYSCLSYFGLIVCVKGLYMKQTGMQRKNKMRKYNRWSLVEAIHNTRIQGIYCNLIIRGHDAAI